MNEKIEKVEKAQTLARYYYALKDYKNYKDMTDAQQADFKKAYEEAKAYRQELINEKDSIYTALRDMLTEDLKGFFQEAKNLLEGK